jgi:NAD(P)-dependent dehydrogenase (short-subunit alcohol dehydrogenase family)
MNRIALITGGNRGLGRASARALADEGTDVILTYRSNPGDADSVVDELSEGGRIAVALPLDTTDHDSFPAFADELRGQLAERWSREQFDILINNAAYSVYAAMKGAIEVYTRYAAKALGARAITVNAIAPGATATDFAGGRIRDKETYRAMVTANHASGRVGEPEDIGGAVRAIVSETAGWITAQRIEASGGQSL